MVQSRTHNCNELRIGDVGRQVVLCGWLENVRRVSRSLAFAVLRDFYGKTQIVMDSEQLISSIDGINCESTVSVQGLVRERSSKNPDMPTGDIEVLPVRIEVLGRCRYNELPFEINRSQEADENLRLKYRYLDLKMCIRDSACADHGPYQGFRQVHAFGRRARRLFTPNAPEQE